MGQLDAPGAGALFEPQQPGIDQLQQIGFGDAGLAQRVGVGAVVAKAVLGQQLVLDVSAQLRDTCAMQRS